MSDMIGMRFQGYSEAELQRVVHRADWLVGARFSVLHAIPVLLALISVSLAVRLIFWWYTGATWEDALITTLHSENFHSGLGLTHFKIDDPRPVHGFTSPISVLVPLVG